jgi:hypothetical protein
MGAGLPSVPTEGKDGNPPLPGDACGGATTTGGLLIFNPIKNFSDMLG